jgi:hypothetical protein
LVSDKNLLFQGRIVEKFTLCVKEKKAINQALELEVFLGDYITQNVVVSDSAFGSILLGIRNLAIACIYIKPDESFDIKWLHQ